MNGAWKFTAITRSWRGHRDAEVADEGDRRVVHQDVEATQLRDGGGDHRLHLAGVGQVRRHRDRLASGGPDAGDRVVERAQACAAARPRWTAPRTPPPRQRPPAPPRSRRPHPAMPRSPTPPSPASPVLESSRRGLRDGTTQERGGLDPQRFLSGCVAVFSDELTQERWRSSGQCLGQCRRSGQGAEHVVEVGAGAGAGEVRLPRAARSAVTGWPTMRPALPSAPGHSGHGSTRTAASLAEHHRLGVQRWRRACTRGARPPDRPHPCGCRGSARPV